MKLAQLCPKIAAGKDVPSKEGVFIGDVFRDFGEAGIGKGHPDVFRLAAVNAAAQLPAALFTVIDKPPAAEPAVPAEGDAVSGHPVSRGQALHLASGFHNLPHKFVAQNDTRLGPGHGSPKDMQVAGADGGEGHPDNGVGTLLEGRDRTVGEGGAGAVPHQGFHGFHQAGPLSK